MHLWAGRAILRRLFLRKHRVGTTCAAPAGVLTPRPSSSEREPTRGTSVTAASRQKRFAAHSLIASHSRSVGRKRVDRRIRSRPAEKTAQVCAMCVRQAVRSRCSAVTGDRMHDHRSMRACRCSFRLTSPPIPAPQPSPMFCCADPPYFAVTYNWMSDLCHVRAQLMRPARSWATSATHAARPARRSTSAKSVSARFAHRRSPPQRRGWQAAHLLAGAAARQFSSSRNARCRISGLGHARHKCPVDRALRCDDGTLSDSRRATRACPRQQQHARTCPCRADGPTPGRCL